MVVGLVGWSDQFGHDVYDDDDSVHDDDDFFHLLSSGMEAFFSLLPFAQHRDISVCWVARERQEGGQGLPSASRADW